MKEKPKYWLAFNRCSTHGFEMISIDDDNGGLRVFGGKCCGSWKTAKRWPIGLSAANECAESFYKIAKELSGGDLARIWAPDALNAGKADLEEKLSASNKRVKELEAVTWQPIETAPMDGFHFIGRLTKKGVYVSVSQIYWDVVTKSWKHAYCPTCMTWSGDFVDPEITVTGWMPLPPPEDK